MSVLDELQRPDGRSRPAKREVTAPELGREGDEKVAHSNGGNLHTRHTATVFSEKDSFLWGSALRSQGLKGDTEVPFRVNEMSRGRGDSAGK